jgi:hypothetical protein
MSCAQSLRKKYGSHEFSRIGNDYVSFTLAIGLALIARPRVTKPRPALSAGEGDGVARCFNSATQKSKTTNSEMFHEANFERTAELRLVDQAVVDGVKSEFKAIGHPEFVEDVVQVILHGLLANK